MEAVQFCIDSLKASVPIWKKVIYADSVFNKLNYIFMVMDWWCYGGVTVVDWWCYSDGLVVLVLVIVVLAVLVAVGWELMQEVSNKVTSTFHTSY